MLTPDNFDRNHPIGVIMRVKTANWPTAFQHHKNTNNSKVHCENKSLITSQITTNTMGHNTCCTSRNI